MNLNQPLKLSVIIFSVFFLVGCLKSSTPETPEERYELFSSGIFEERDEFKKTTMVYSAVVPDDNIKGFHCENVHCLDTTIRMFFDKNGKRRFTQIYFRAEIYDWVFFDRAVFDDGTSMEFREIDRKVYSADNLVEIFAVTISDEIFEKLKKRNRKISIRGKVFDWVVTIPKEVATSLDDYTKKKFPQ